MSTHVKVLDTKCPHCGAPMQEVHMKNPYIDDSHDDCTNPKCDDFGRAIQMLNASARSQARQEHA